MKLQRLELTNFKGIRRFILEPNGANISVYGDNGTGKTSIFDAFSFLLFGKDSLGQSDFEIKTLSDDGAWSLVRELVTDHDEDSDSTVERVVTRRVFVPGPNHGKPLPGIDHMVEATFILEDGESLTLGKVYKEVWTKPRGNKGKAEFSGHTTDHYVNRVPVQKKEYDSRIAGICEERRFRLLTDPAYFASVMHWQDRRRMLLEVCGSVSADDVIAACSDLQTLPALLGNHSPDDYKKILKARREKINDELERIPTRIDEATRSMPAPLPVSGDSLEELQQQMKALIEKQAGLNSAGEIAELNNQLRECEGRLLDLANQKAKEETGESERLQEQYRKAMGAVSDAEGRKLQLESKLRAVEATINECVPRIEAVREKWRVENAKTFTALIADTCPACGSLLPEERLAEARAKAEAAFNLEKSERLAIITEDGKRLAAQLKADQATIENWKSELASLEDELVSLNSAAYVFKAKADSVTETSTVPDPRRSAILAEKMAIEERISVVRAGNSETASMLESKIKELGEQIGLIQQQETLSAQRAELENRIEQLKAREKDLATDLEQIESETWMIEEFTRQQAKMLESKINDKFKFTRFKLFDTQVNGGLTEVCELTVGGVPYHSLNTGMRINAGLDVIASLSEHFHFAPPIFIDGAESITSLLPTPGQQIRLVVSGNDPALRVVNHAKEPQEALL